MGRPLDTELVAIVAGCLVVWALVSARLARADVTAPLAFVVLGLVTTQGPLALTSVTVSSSTIKSLAELTLAVVLFVDASRVNLHAVRADLQLPTRLLGLGLPLTVAIGAAAAAVLNAGMSFWLAALLAAVVAPTDAALAAPILQDDRVPHRVRRVLNVESGLNDGLATPLVTLFLAGALAQDTLHAAGIGHAALELLNGVAIGVGVGVGGAAALRWSQRHRWLAPPVRPIGVFGLALLAYAATVEAGGNGFVAAFLAGGAFGALMPSDDELTVGFTDDVGQVLSLIVWFLFGAVMLVGFRHARWTDVAFAVLALTVVRMGPVAVALLGAGLDRSTVAFIGWFGPRGLASVIFGLLAFDALPTGDGYRILAAMTVTVTLSVVAHGLSGSPLARRYGEHSRSLHAQRPEHQARPGIRTRTLAARRGP